MADNAEIPNAVFVELVAVYKPLPMVNWFTIISELNVFAPAKVCAPVVTTPPKEALAGSKLSALPDIVPPLAFGDDPIAAKVVIPAGLAHEGTPEAKVNTCPSVPLAKRVPVPAVPP